MEIEGGALGMREGEYKNGKIEGQKFYVLGRGRYQPFDLEDGEKDMRNTLPLAAEEAWQGLKDNLDDQTWAALGEALTGESGPSRTLMFRKFVDLVWKPTVKKYLLAHSGLISDEHNPQLSTEGKFCYDVRVLKLMKKKQSDLDINGDITKMRAIEILRILHTKLQLLPKAFTTMLMRGQRRDGTYEGLDPDDMAFAYANNEDFRFLPGYDGDDNTGPTYRTVRHTWGLELHAIKPGHEDEHENYIQLDTRPIPGSRSSSRLSGGQIEQMEQSIEGGKTNYNATKTGARNKFGRPDELEALQWSSKNDARLGHKDGLICAWTFRNIDDMRALVQDAPRLVWIPPLHVGRADGYFLNNDEDQDAIKKWTILGYHKTSINPENWGLRGGHIFEYTQ